MLVEMIQTAATHYKKQRVGDPEYQEDLKERMALLAEREER